MPALRTRLLWTIGAVVLFRLGQGLPLPGVRVDALPLAASARAEGADRRWYGLVELVTGGGLGALSVCAFGVLPLLAARLVMAPARRLVPRLRALDAAGDQGRALVARRTRRLAVLLAAVAAGVVTVRAVDTGCVPLSGLCSPGGAPLVVDAAATVLGQVALAACLTAGAAAVALLAGLITHRGFGEGVSILFLAQLAAVVPGHVAEAARASGGRTVLVPVLLAAALVVVTAVVIVLVQSERRVPVQRAKRMIGRTSGPTPTYVPLSLARGGLRVMIPASLLLLVPWPAGGWLLAPYALTVFAHAWYRAGIGPETGDVTDRMKRSGLFVPGVRVGPPTAEYLGYVQSRVGFFGALGMTAVALAPVAALTVLDGPADAYALSATTLLVVVNAAVTTVLPTARQIASWAAVDAYGHVLR
ncbi:hypothetical protein [Streptomyces sp. NPDC003327]